MVALLLVFTLIHQNALKFLPLALLSFSASKLPYFVANKCLTSHEKDKNT
ncbi:hypothetical protein V6Z11_D11G168700 [Gossypium hirsutum]